MDEIADALDAQNYPVAADLIARCCREEGPYELGPRLYLEVALGHRIEVLDEQLDRHGLCIGDDGTGCLIVAEDPAGWLTPILATGGL